MPLERVHVGYRCPAYGTREFEALEVATQILAGGRGSRLHKRLVRDEQVAQDVALFALPLVAGSSIAAGWVTARPESDAATVEGMLDEELQRMTRESVTDDELARAHALIESAELSARSRTWTRWPTGCRCTPPTSAGPSSSTNSWAATSRSTPRPYATCAPRSSAPMSAPPSPTSLGPARRSRHDGPAFGPRPRPSPGEPRDYDFPDFERTTMANGLTLVRAHVPGRPLLQAQLLVRGDAGGGGTSEAPEHAGATVLTGASHVRGHAVRDAVAFVEASERLGAEIGAAAGWDSLAVHVEVPRAHLVEAMGLFAEMALQPSFPDREVERLRDERLNDLQQVMADAGRRAEKAFPAVIYGDGAAYARPLGGTEETVATLDRDVLADRHAAADATRGLHAARLRRPRRARRSTPSWRGPSATGAPRVSAL